MRHRVLIVDDEPDILESLAWLLAECLPTVEVRAAASGEDARGLLEREDFDLVITDHRMPGMTGLQLATWIHERGGPPTVMYTAYPDMSLAIEACNRGGVHTFFPKTYGPEDLLETVRDALHKRAWELQRRSAYARAEAFAHGMPRSASAAPA